MANYQISDSSENVKEDDSFSPFLFKEDEEVISPARRLPVYEKGGSSSAKRNMMKRRFSCDGPESASKKMLFEKHDDVNDFSKKNDERYEVAKRQASDFTKKMEDQTQAAVQLSEIASSINMMQVFLCAFFVRQEGKYQKWDDKLEEADMKITKKLEKLKARKNKIKTEIDKLEKLKQDKKEYTLSDESEWEKLMEGNRKRTN